MSEMPTDGHREDDASALGSATEPAGWDAIGEWTGGIDPEFNHCARRRPWSRRGLSAAPRARRSHLRDFLVRAAALQCVVAADNAWLDGA